MNQSARQVLRGAAWLAAAYVCFGATVSTAADVPPKKAPVARTASAPAPAAPVARTAAAPEAALPIKEFMAHVVAFAAQNLWNKQGWITDKTGTRSLLPKNEQQWEDAESASLTLSEVIGILLEPSRRLNVPGWDSHAQRVRQLAQQSAAAAEKHDVEAFMNIGSEIEEACEGCHRAAGLR